MNICHDKTIKKIELWVNNKVYNIVKQIKKERAKCLHKF